MARSASDAAPFPPRGADALADASHEPRSPRAHLHAGLVVLHVISSHVARSSGWAAPLIVLLLAALVRLAD